LCGQHLVVRSLDFVHQAQGDRLLFYTNGLTDATNAKGQPLGRDGLMRIAADARDTTFFNLADNILAQQAKFRDGDPRDDVALIVAEVK
jgi:serine phosphatase RsbU (regulator of sigma subunit)